MESIGLLDCRKNGTRKHRKKLKKEITKDQIIKQRYPFYDPMIAQKDIEINAEGAKELMEDYLLQVIQQKENDNNVESVLKEILDYIDSFHGSGHDYWWINSKIRDKVYWMLKRLKDNDH